MRMIRSNRLFGLWLFAVAFYLVDIQNSLYDYEG